MEINLRGIALLLTILLKRLSENLNMVCTVTYGASHASDREVIKARWPAAAGACTHRAGWYGVSLVMLLVRWWTRLRRLGADFKVWRAALSHCNGNQTIFQSRKAWKWYSYVHDTVYQSPAISTRCQQWIPGSLCRSSTIKIGIDRSAAVMDTQFVRVNFLSFLG